MFRKGHSEQGYELRTGRLSYLTSGLFSLIAKVYTTLCSSCEKFCISKPIVNVPNILLHKGIIKGCASWVTTKKFKATYHFRFCMSKRCFSLSSILLQRSLCRKFSFQKIGIKISWRNLLKIKQKQQVRELPLQIDGLVVSEAWETDVNMFLTPPLSHGDFETHKYIYEITFCVPPLVGWGGRRKRQRDWFSILHQTTNKREVKLLKLFL